MNRRNFLLRNTTEIDSVDPPSVSSIAADLTPYLPRPEKPWTARRAAHLLRRTGFGPTWGELAAATASTPAPLLDALLLPPAEQPSIFFQWTTQEPFDADVDIAIRMQFYTSWFTQLQFWWIGLMLDTKSRLSEKMTLFLHGLLVSENTKVEVTQYMYIQNRLLREFATGNFRELVKRITVDPGMLIYLDGAGSNAGNPNENYARELLELFTIGTGFYGNGTPHYTEQDIVELARSLTGWRPQGLGSTFDPAAFDSTPKSIFGVSANFGMHPEAERNPIDVIFEQVDPDHGRKRVAIYLCTKLYQFFVFEVPDMTIVAAMAKTLEDNNWEMAPVLRELFNSEHFFDDEAIGGMMKSPVDLVIGAMSTFKLQITINVDPGDPESHDAMRAMGFLGQTILQPPNVKGWIGGKSWISTATLPLRIRYTKLWIQPPALPTTAPYNFKPVEFVLALPDHDNVHKVLDHFLELLLPMPISDRVKGLLLDTLLGGAPDYEWDPAAFEGKIRNCLVTLTNLGEYQLM